MKDLTQGPVIRHLLELSAFLAVSMFFQTLYYLVDLYFVSGIGKAAIAGVSQSGNVMLATVALTQTLGVGTASLIAQAAGRKDRADAQLIFNQSFFLSLIVGLFMVVFGYLFRMPFCRLMSADEATVEQAAGYLKWFIPALGLQFALVSMGSALRGTGIVKPTMIVQIVTVLVNIMLAPVLIAGWGTGRPYGVQGAAFCTLIAMGLGVTALTVFFLKLEQFVGFDRTLWWPRLDVWKRMVSIGLPAGGEFAVLSIFSGLVYWIIRHSGAGAQAGFGIGQRVMQSLFLPAMAIAFAASPLAGQNFGAGRMDRVREVFRAAALLSLAVMGTTTVICQFLPQLVIRVFTSDGEVAAYGAEYLRIVSWGFVASGFIFTSSGMFQALGNTLPSLASSAGRLAVFAFPAVWMSQQPAFRLTSLWYFTVATAVLQASANLLLLRREFARKLTR